jgi:hypothetical protein
VFVFVFVFESSVRVARARLVGVAAPCGWLPWLVDERLPLIFYGTIALAMRNFHIKIADTIVP